MWFVRELIDNLLCTYHPFHQNAAEAMFELRLGFPVFPFIVERLVIAILAGPSAYHPTLYYTAALFDMCKMATSEPLTPTVRAAVPPCRRAAVPPRCRAACVVSFVPPPACCSHWLVFTTAVHLQLGMAVRVLYKYAPAIDETALDRLSMWLTHHTSNFGFQWMWNEWCVAVSRR